MSLLVKIKADQLAARKEQLAVKAALLTTLIGESEMIGKNAGNRETNDTEVVAVIKKFIKNIDETLGHLKDFPTSFDYTRGVLEKQILEEYLPKQLNELELRTLIFDVIAVRLENSGIVVNKGTVMKELKNGYSGQYDGKLAAAIVSEQW